MFCTFFLILLLDWGHQLFLMWNESSEHFFFSTQSAALLLFPHFLRHFLVMQRPYLLPVASSQMLNDGRIGDVVVESSRERGRRGVGVGVKLNTGRMLCLVLRTKERGIWCQCWWLFNEGGGRGSLPPVGGVHREGGGVCEKGGDHLF